MRKSLFRATAILALNAAGGAQAAQTQQCITRTDMRGMVGYFLPSLLDTTIKTCGKQLPDSAFLRTRGPQLVGELSAGRETSWPAARAAFGKLGGDDGQMDKVPDEVMKPLIDSLISQQLGPKITPGNCADIERVLAPMAPLPAANMADLVTEVFMVALRKDKKMRTCA